MKRNLILFSFLVLSVVPGWCEKKITVGQLEDMLRSLQQQKKDDGDVATALKQVELTEELTPARMNGLVNLVPGRLSTEQIFVLEARSADLIPPPADLPSTPAPDESGLKAILSRAESYVGRTYAALPALTATKTTVRFQDNVDALANSSGVSGSAKEMVTSSAFSSSSSYIHFINSNERSVLSERGIEELAAEKVKTPWGANKMVAIQQADPNLADVFKRAEAAGKIEWLRWELINGRPAAVFSFAVPTQKNGLDVSVCCFPNVKQAGKANFYNSTMGPMFPGSGASGGGVSGNFQTNTDWHEFKTTVPYHGRLFIDPETGIVVRMITEAELKPTDLVHQLDTRVDYGPVKIGERMIVAPVKTVINSEVVPNGDSGAGGYTTRCTLFTSEYKNYRIAKSK